MEIEDQTSSRKRKFEDIYPDYFSKFPLNELNQDLLERVLSWLPASTLFRLTSVCKKWRSATYSPTFRIACSEIPSRQPWFFMVRSNPHKLTHRTTSVIFDSTEENWKKLKNPLLPYPKQDSFADPIPVAASAGLILFRRTSAAGGDFLVANPVTASSRQIPNPETLPILAIAMVSKPESYKIVLVTGELPNLKFRQYHSITDHWEDNIFLTRKSDGPEKLPENDDVCTHYFLSKCGNVVSTDMQRSPSKQFSSVLTVKNGDDILYFLSSSGTIVSCNLGQRIFFEYPRILPVFSEYSIDLIEIGGEMCVVLLSEILDSATLRVWTWDDKIETWRQVAAMPPSMSHKFYGKKVDINCAGGGRKMFVCVNSEEICSYVTCDLGRDEWVELPDCCNDNDGRVDEFVTAFSFEPRIEASVWGRKTYF